MSVFIVSFLPVGFITGLPVPASGSHSTSSTSAPVTLPFFPMNLRVDRPHLRVHPSSWLLLVFRTRGHCGHGVAGFSPTGGFGIISICVTLEAPLPDARADAVASVSPPPITSTFLPFALMRASFGKVCPASTLFCWRASHPSQNESRSSPCPGLSGLWPSECRCRCSMHQTLQGSLFVSISCPVRNTTPSALHDFEPPVYYGLV